jgi:vancomycin resistance protein YoaR
VLIVLIVALVVAIAVFAGIGVYAMQYVNYDKILPNVYVAGIDVGGMTVDEATAVIESSLSTTEQQSVNVILPDQVLTFTPEQDTVLIDVDQAVAAAYSYGRSSTNPFAMSRAIKAAQRRRNDIDISTAVDVDTDYIRSLIDTTAQEVTTPMVDSTVNADEAAHTITVTIGTPGKELDTDTLYDLVSTAFSTGDYSDISFEYTMTYPATVALDTLYAQMTTEPTDAKYNSDTGEIDAEVVGYTPSVDLDKANEQLAMAAAGETLTFTFDETPASITKEELEPMLFRDTLASYGSVYASNAGRTTNLRLACEAINGTVLQPGEIFSFNDVVGERTAEKGYQEATVYVSGDSVPALGGGICQVASTIYYCCMYADLEIVEREEHMFFVTYVPGGLDATVYWGSQDFQFKNSTDYPMKIEAYLSNGKVQINLIGTDVNHYTIEIDSNKVSTTNFESIVKEGTGTDQSGYTGYVYTITRRVYDASGNLIRTDTTADLDNMGGLGTSTYNKRDKVTYTGSSSSSSSSSGSSGSRDDDDDEPTTSPSTSPSTQPSTNPSTEPTTAPTTAPTTEPTQAPDTSTSTTPSDTVTPAPDVPAETTVDE